MKGDVRICGEMRGDKKDERKESRLEMARGEETRGHKEKRQEDKRK